MNTLFTARRVITMDPDRPSAEAVAVRDGLIVAVGAVDEVRSSLVGQEFVVDTQFADSVLITGLSSSASQRPYYCAHSGRRRTRSSACRSRLRL